MNRSVVLAAIAALGYGTTLTLQAWLAERGLASSTVLTMRFGGSGVLLLALCALTRRPLVPARGERLQLLLLGAIFFMVPAELYYRATQHGSPAAAIVLVYLYPILVTLAEAVQARQRPRSVVLGALALSTVGCCAVALQGTDVSIEPIGVALALGSAAAFSAYVFLSGRAGKRSDPMTIAAWVALGAAASFVVRVIIGPGFEHASGNWPALIGTGVANAVGFGLMYEALRHISAARVSVVLTLEAVFTVLLTAVFLDDTLAPLQIAGAAAVLVAAAIVGRSQQQPTIVESV